MALRGHFGSLGGGQFLNNLEGMLFEICLIKVLSELMELRLISPASEFHKLIENSYFALRVLRFAVYTFNTFNNLLYYEKINLDKFKVIIL